MRRAGIEAGLLGVAALDMVLENELTGWLPWPFGAVALCGVLLRRRYPYLALALCFPALITSFADVPALITLYSVARHVRDRRLLIGIAALVAVAHVLKLPFDTMSETTQELLVDVIYGLLMGAAPAALGQLVLARAELSRRLEEISEAREHEQRLVAQQVLAKERAQLAREMHDVVSHQVSLIAVQAGALQVGAGDQHVRESASTIRRLSVNTLDELRHMVALLRAANVADVGTAPQPTLAEIDQLIATSGIDVRLEGSPPTGLDTPTQRAIYRTVQEALTNVRKHAPGAGALVEIATDATGLHVTITNTPPTRPALALPSARHGLTGLRERAELLGGTLHAEPTPTGGFRLRLSLPKGS
ncbi:sensor histidine kinase [Pseudonocardia acaciae]|uniref:sensor histidine kinase n=1 Tax=Pseudonocardia acaciae TaxID=551276 RepID=UPI000AA76C2B|nr:histidine kinase [Pseudonocardia acaciae]